MTSFKKTLLSFLLVAGISSGISIALFSAMQEKNDNTSSLTDTTTPNSTYATPTAFTPVVSRPAVENDFTQAAANTVNAVVSIKSTTVQQRSSSSMEEEFFRYFFGQGRRDYAPQPRIGMGSGVIISEDGYIVTNNHVIDQADKIEVTLNDKRSFEATLIGSDASTDIALLKIDAEKLPIVKFGDSDKLQVGEWVLAVGNPFQLNSTVTAGIVSAKSRNLGMLSPNSRLGIESFIQTDAAVITPAAKPVSPFCRPSDIAFFIKNTLAAPREVPKNGSRSPYNASIIHPFSSCVRNQYPCVQNTGFPHRCQIHFPTGWPFTNPENRCRSGQQGASLLCLTQGTGCRMAPFPLISGSF